MKTVSIELTKDEAEILEIATNAHGAKLDEVIRETPMEGASGIGREFMINQKAKTDNVAARLKDAISRS